MTIKDTIYSEPGLEESEEFYVDEQIGPWLASEYLKRNRVNRPLRKQAMHQYAALMTGGEWLLTPQGISFATIDGEEWLIDGQTRLNAIIQAKVEVPMRVWRNVDPLARFAMDTGQKRSLKDALVIKGVQQAGQVAAAITSLARFQVADNHPRDIARARRTRLHPITGLRLFEANPGVVESTFVGGRVYRAIGFPASAGSATHYQIATAEPQECEVFFEHLVSGAGLNEGHPILALREKIHRALDQKPRPKDIDYAAWLRKAWNAYLTGEDMFRLRWSPGGSIREAFPQIKTTY